MGARRRLVLSSSLPAALACAGAALALSAQPPTSGRAAAPAPAAAAPSAASAATTTTTTAATTAEATANAPDFARDVQPILAATCIRCHGEAKQKGKLRLDTREGMLSGGEYGPVLVPGEPGESPIYKNLVARDPVHRMPQESDPLPAAEIETIRRWIAAGAPWPAGVVVADASRPAPSGAARPRGPVSVSFNRDVRPILAESCFVCHGPDRNRREAGLRLDVEETAKAALRSGVVPIVPGAPEKSALLARVTDPDETRRMPLAKSGKPRLPAAQVGVLRRWIEEGAAWEPHWSYVPLARPSPPAVRNAAWARNAVDAFLLARLEAEGLAPSAEAPRAELLRRASFDLMGLPPTAEEVRAFDADPRKDAYERQVDRLLASPRYGERMAVFWLDLVRYADSVGYHSDNARPMWRYRDWVVSAFNRNLPFDRFTAEQLAGDLLPAAGFDERIASGYNRLLQTTEEGGAQPKEYRAIYLADRARNASGVWMGATMGCAQCHDHKFDPYSTRDFYALEAFFADVKEEPVGRRKPDVLPDPEQKARLDALAEAVEHRRAALCALSEKTPRAAWEEALRARRPARFTTLEPVEASSANGTRVLIQGNDFSVIASTSHGPRPEKDTYTVRYKTELKGVTALRLEAVTFEELPEGGPGRDPRGGFVVSEMEVRDASGRPLALRHASASTVEAGGALSAAAAIDGRTDGGGWGLAAADGESHRLVVELEEPAGTGAETSLTLVLHQNAGARRTLGRFRLAGTSDALPVRTEPGAEPDGGVKEALAVPEAQRTPEQQKTVMDFFRRSAPELAAARSRLREAELAKAAFAAAVPSAYVTSVEAPAPVRVLPRGNWQDDSGEVVAPAPPHFLPPLDTGGRAATRLDLARWLTARDNPLTARVLANRLFKLAFGQGLSRTVEDLGAQGEWPTHPELLDWLAVELQESGWDVKRLLRTLVTSAAYRQASSLDPRLLERDPANRLYARQSRFRLDAEMVRDNALAVARAPLPARRRGERAPVPARRVLGLPQLPTPRVGRLGGRGAVPPRALHVVAAGVPAAEPRRLRRAEPRGVRGRSRALERAPAGARPPQRPDVRRGRARLRRAHRARRGTGRRRAAALRVRPRAAAGAGRGRAPSARRAPREGRRAVRAGPRRRPPPRGGRAGEGRGGPRPRRARRVDAGGAGDPQPARGHDAVVSEERAMEILTDDLVALRRRVARRSFLSRAGAGFGSAFLLSLLDPKALLAAPDAPGAADAWPGVVRPLHFPARAKRVIHLYQAGGPSHLELFDRKPELEKRHGEPMPESFTKGQPIAQLQGQALKCFAPQHPFARYGASGQEISTLLPEIGGIADDICILRSMQTEQINHDPAHTFMNTGTQISGRPAAGSWAWYGLGCGRRRPARLRRPHLPGPRRPDAADRRAAVAQRLSARAASRASTSAPAATPSCTCATPRASRADAAARRHRRRARAERRARRLGRRPRDRRRGIAQYELAFRMQASVPELADLRRSPSSVRALYGVEAARRQLRRELPARPPARRARRAVRAALPPRLGPPQRPEGRHRHEGPRGRPRDRRPRARPQAARAARRHARPVGRRVRPHADGAERRPRPPPQRLLDVARRRRDQAAASRTARPTSSATTRSRTSSTSTTSTRRCCTCSASTTRGSRYRYLGPRLPPHRRPRQGGQEDPRVSDGGPLLG